MGYKRDGSKKMSFDAQRVYAYNSVQQHANARPTGAHTHCASGMDTLGKPQPIRIAQPEVRATTTAVETMQPSAFESATHTSGVFSVVPHRFPDAEQGTESATTTTGTVWIAQ